MMHFPSFKPLQTHALPPAKRTFLTGIKHVLRACSGPLSIDAEAAEDKQDVIRNCMMGMSEAVKGGDIVDLGLIPSEVLRQQATAYPNLAHAGAIQHPFGDRPYVLTLMWTGARWKVGDEAMRVTYIVEPKPRDSTTYRFTQLVVDQSGTFIVICLGVVRAPLGKAPGEISGGWAMSGPHMPADELYAVAVRCINGALTILNTKGVASTVKSGKARRGKVLVPSHHKVDTRDYVTAITRKRSGSHKTTVPSGRAPVIPHLRRGHWALIPETYEPHGRHRQCPDDPNRIEIWRSEALVNCASEEELSFASRQRTSYKMERV